MKFHPPVIAEFKKELSDWQLWTGRAMVIAFAAIAGMTVVAFTWLTEHALTQFFSVQHIYWWAPLIWTPASTAIIVWFTLRFAPGAAGSGIPQVMAALEPSAHGCVRQLYVSLRLSVVKIVLTTWGLLAGLSLGREGPSVQIAAGVMQNARRWMASGISRLISAPLYSALAVLQLLRLPLRSAQKKGAPKDSKIALSRQP